MSPNFGSPYLNEWPDGAIAFSNNYPTSKHALFDAGIYQQLSVPSSFFAASTSSGAYSSSVNSPLSVFLSLGMQPTIKEQAKAEQAIAKQAVTSEIQYALVALMGSVTNLVISILCLLLLYIFKPKGILLVVGVCGALLNYDLLFYGVFPIVFDLPHLIFWGGNTSEPIIALVTLGINQYLSLVTIIALSLIQWWVLYRILSSSFVSNRINKGVNKRANNFHILPVNKA